MMSVSLTQEELLGRTINEPLDPNRAAQVLKHDARTIRIIEAITAVIMMCLLVIYAFSGDTGVGSTALLVLAFGVCTPIALEACLWLERHRVARGLYGTWQTEVSHAQELAKRGIC